MWCIKPASLLGANHKCRSAPQGAWSFKAGDWGPPSPSAGCTLPPHRTRAARGAAIHSGWENGQGPLNPRRPSKMPRTKMLGPRLMFTSTLTSAQLAARRTGGVSGLPASWGLTLTVGRPPRGPSRVAGHRNAEDGDPEEVCRTHPAALQPPEPLGSLRSFRAGERAWHSESPATFEGPPQQNAWANAPAHQCLHLGTLLHSPHSQVIGRASLQGAIPNPRSAPEGTLPRGLESQSRGLGTPKPQRQMHPAAPPHTGR